MTDSHHPTDTATADALESVTSTEQSIAQHDDVPTEQPEAAGDPVEADSADAEPTDAASTEVVAGESDEGERDSASGGNAEVARDGSAGRVGSASGDRAAGESGAGSVRDDGAEPAVSAADGSAADSGDGVAGGFDNVDPDAVLGDEVSDEVASGSEDDGLPSAVGDGASSGSSAGVGGVAEELLLGLEGVPAAGEVVIDDVGMRQALEAILMVTDEPLPAMVLARAVGRPVSDVGEALTGLAEEYTEQGRGFDLREVGGGWRYYTRPEQAQFVEKFVLDGQQARLTQAALETLAVVAYKQPVSRARVSAIRGVNVDGVMRTLISRGLVEDAGADTESQATLYRTSTYFLERMGMQSLDDLPELAPYLPEMDDVEEELAAQNAPIADDLGTEGSTTPEAGTPVGGTTEAGTAEAGTPVGGLPDGVTPPAVGTPEPAEAVTSDVGAAGIDGDLSIGDTPELDLEHDEEELAPAEELEAGGSTDLEQEEADPAEIPESHTGDDGATESDSDDAADADADFDAAESDAADTGGDEIRGGLHPLQGSESSPVRTMKGVRAGGDLADADTSHDDDILEDDDNDDVDDENERLQAAEELTGETEDNRLQAAEELTGETEDNRLQAAEELTGETEDLRMGVAEELTDETDATGDVPAEGDAGTADEPGPGDAQYRIGSDD